MLLPLLVCSEFRVRRERLEEAYRSWSRSHGEPEHEVDTSPARHGKGVTTLVSKPSGGVSWAFGIWAGSTLEEREALSVKGLTKERAIERLDRTLEERVGVRIRAYLRSRRHGPNRYVDRVDMLLRETGHEVPERTSARSPPSR